MIRHRRAIAVDRRAGPLKSVSPRPSEIGAGVAAAIVLSAVLSGSSVSADTGALDDPCADPDTHVALPGGGYRDCATGEDIGVTVHLTLRDIRSMGQRHFAKNEMPMRGSD